MELETVFAYLRTYYDIREPPLGSTTMRVILPGNPMFTQVKCMAMAILHFEPAIERLEPMSERRNCFARSNYIEGCDLGRAGRTRDEAIEFVSGTTSLIDLVQTMQQAPTPQDNQVVGHLVWDLGDLFQRHAENRWLNYRLTPKDPAYAISFNLPPTPMCVRQTGNRIIDLRPTEIMSWAAFLVLFTRSSLNIDTYDDFLGLDRRISGLWHFLTPSATPQLRAYLRHLMTNESFHEEPFCNPSAWPFPPEGTDEHNQMVLDAHYTTTYHERLSLMQLVPNMLASDWVFGPPDEEWTAENMRQNSDWLLEELRARSAALGAAAGPAPLPPIPNPPNIPVPAPSNPAAHPPAIPAPLPRPENPGYWLPPDMPIPAPLSGPQPTLLPNEPGHWTPPTIDPHPGWGQPLPPIPQPTPFGIPTDPPPSIPLPTPGLRGGSGSGAAAAAILPSLSLAQPTPQSAPLPPATVALSVPPPVAISGGAPQAPTGPFAPIPGVRSPPPIRTNHPLGATVAAHHPGGATAAHHPGGTTATYHPGGATAANHQPGTPRPGVTQRASGNPGRGRRMQQDSRLGGERGANRSPSPIGRFIGRFSKKK